MALMRARWQGLRHPLQQGAPPGRASKSCWEAVDTCGELLICRRRHSPRRRRRCAARLQAHSGSDGHRRRVGQRGRNREKMRSSRRAGARVLRLCMTMPRRQQAAQHVPPRMLSMRMVVVAAPAARRGGHQGACLQKSQPRCGTPHVVANTLPECIACRRRTHAAAGQWSSWRPHACRDRQR